MSGIVRGFASESEMIHVRETQLNCPEDVALLGVRSIANDTRKIPVAVVPLDDATLAGMAEKIARVDFAHSDYGTWEATSQSHRTAFIDVALKGLRAALGLGGEGA